MIYGYDKEKDEGAKERKGSKRRPVKCPSFFFIGDKADYCKSGSLERWYYGL